MNWTEAFEEARKAGGALEKVLEPAEFARALRALDAANQGLSVGDPRYQEACCLGRLTWWDESGSMVRIRRKEYQQHALAARAGLVPAAPMPGNPIEAGLTATAHLDVLRELADRNGIAMPADPIDTPDPSRDPRWQRVELVADPSVVTATPGYRGTITLDPNPAPPEPVDLGPAPVTLKPAQPKKKGKR